MKHYASFFGLLFFLVGFSPCCATGDTVADLAKRLKNLDLTNVKLCRSTRFTEEKTPEMTSEQIKKINICPDAPCKKIYKKLLHEQKKRRKTQRRIDAHPYLRSSQKKTNLKSAKKSENPDDIIKLGGEVLNFLKNNS